MPTPRLSLNALIWRPFLLWLLAFPVSSFAASAPDDWTRFQFEGNRTFTSEQLRSALIAEPDFLLANHPNSNNADVHEVTKRLLIAGYQDAGFHSPSIQMETAEDGTTKVRIDEGTRTYCHLVKVKGTTQINRDSLIEICTEPRLNADAFPVSMTIGGHTTTRWIDSQGANVVPESPIWQKGEPVGPTTPEKLRVAIKSAFEQLGYAQATFDVTLERTDDHSTVDLCINILEEGTQDRIEEFKITGGTSNSPAQVLAFLDLEPGRVYDRELKRRLTEKLYRSGRFKKHLVSFERRSNREGCLTIELVDVPGMPLLSEPLSPEASILLRARQWLSESDPRGEDFVLEMEGEGVKLQAIYSNAGTLVQYDPSPQGDIGSTVKSEETENAEGSLGRTTLLIDPQRICIGNDRCDSIWSADVSGFGGWISLETGFNAAETDEHFGTMAFHVNWKSVRPPGEPLFHQALRLTPAGWCAFAYKKSVEIHNKDGKLVLRHGKQLLEIESETGRILQFETVGARVMLKSGVFDQQRNAFLQEIANKKNQYNEQKPVSSLIRFGVSESGLAMIEGFRKGLEVEKFSVDYPLCSALEKLAQADLFLPLDAFTVNSREWTRVERFKIPNQSSGSKDFLQMLFGETSKFVLGWLPKLFAEGTWPMKIAREACLVSLDRGKYAGQVVQELLSDPKDGPLRDSSAAVLLTMINHPQAKPFANRALLTMVPEAFEKDKQILLSGSFGQWIAGLLKAVGSLDEQERDAIVNRITSEKMKSFFLSLHAQAQADASSQTLWYDATHAIIEAKLREIAGR